MQELLQVMSPGSEISMNTDKTYLSVPTLTGDGSNWITFKIRLLMSTTTSGLSCHLEGTVVAPTAPALDMSQPNRWSEDEKKAYGGYRTALAKWEQMKMLPALKLQV